jgi:hypothetical protein
MTAPDHTAIARQIYRELKASSCGMADWRVCDVYNLAAADLRQVIAASNGHLRLRPPGIVEAMKLETKG